MKICFQTNISIRILNQMALEFFHNSSGTPLLSALLSKFQQKKFMNIKESAIWIFCIYLFFRKADNNGILSQFQSEFRSKIFSQKQLEHDFTSLRRSCSSSWYLTSLRRLNFLTSLSSTSFWFLPILCDSVASISLKFSLCWLSTASRCLF